MGFSRGKLERCLFVHESNETPVVSHVDDPLILCNTSDIGELLAHHKAGRDQERRGAHPALTCGVPEMRIPQLSRA